MSKLIEDFNKLENDKARWGFVLASKSKLRLSLDNDDTMVIDDNASEDDENNYGSFDNYVGWSDGVITLLNAIGLDADSC
tara:strand:- start:359 stop:598 length:240 start_codon:yes stop_codon:yes gene_type:complete